MSQVAARFDRVRRGLPRRCVFATVVPHWSKPMRGFETPLRHHGRVSRPGGMRVCPTGVPAKAHAPAS